jgi:MFS transporter, DHA2 family, multidrug resistance protein
MAETPLSIAGADRKLAKSAPRDGLDGPSRYLAIAVVSLATILTAIDGNIVNIALPTIMDEFQIDAASSVLIVNAYQIGMLVFLLPLSALGAVIGHRRVFLAGMALFVLASAACAMAHSLWELTAARTLQGIGGAGIVAVLHALVRAIYPARLLGRGLGINSMFAAASAASGPSVAALILAGAAWPWLFAINIPLGLAAMAIGAFVLPWNELSKERYDFQSALLCAVTFGLLIFALDSISHGGNPYIAVAALAGAVAAAPFLVKRQRGRTAPLLPFDLFTNRIIPLSLAAAQAAFVGQVVAFVTLPFFLSNAGLTQVQIGMAMTPWPLAMAATAPIAGILCDRHAPWLVGAIGLLLATAGLLLLAFLPEGTGAADVMWRMAICGIGFGLFGPPNMKQIVSAAPKSRSGTVSGMIGANRLTGQSIGAALAALVLNVVTADANLAAMVLAASMTLLAACFSLARAAGS